MSGYIQLMLTTLKCNWKRHFKYVKQSAINLRQLNSKKVIIYINKKFSAFEFWIFMFKNIKKNLFLLFFVVILEYKKDKKYWRNYRYYYYMHIVEIICWFLVFKYNVCMFESKAHFCIKVTAKEGVENQIILKT